MSMIGHLRAITPAELSSLRKNPGSVRQFLHGKLEANTGNVQAALLRIQEMAMQAMAAGKSKDNEELREKVMAELRSVGATGNPYGEHDLSLEKSWHCLHYLLTGSAVESDSALGKAILGGKQIGPDVGYGPARYLEPGEVRQVADALKAISIRDLALRFDLKDMMSAKIYACGDESDLELAQEYFVEMLKFYDEAAARGNAMLLYLD